jgi:hypothetical protein
MPRVTSAELQVNRPIEGAAPDATLVITMDASRPLAVGRYVFQLEVLDDTGNRSQPIRAVVAVIDTQAPNARISAPPEVPFNTEFILSGAESRDVGGGTIARYIWTLLG